MQADLFARQCHGRVRQVESDRESPAALPLQMIGAGAHADLKHTLGAMCGEAGEPGDVRFLLVPFRRELGEEGPAIGDVEPTRPARFSFPMRANAGMRHPFAIGPMWNAL
jgi:hypothetical protein